MLPSRGLPAWGFPASVVGHSPLARLALSHGLGRRLAISGQGAYSVFFHHHQMETYPKPGQHGENENPRIPALTGLPAPAKVKGRFTGGSSPGPVTDWQSWGG